MSQDELDTSTGVEEVIDLDDPEPRWPAFVAAIAVGGLYTALPDALTMGPRWLFPSAVLALLVPTIVSHHAGKRKRSIRHYFRSGKTVAHWSTGRRWCNGHHSVARHK